MRTLVSVLRTLAVGIVVVCAAAAQAGYVTFGNGWGSKWDDPVFGTPATVTWGFVPDGTLMAASFPLAPEVVGTSQLSQLRSQVDAVYGAGAFDGALQRAFDTWHAVAGITFVGPVADPGLPLGAAAATTPDIRIAAFAPLSGSGFSYVGAVGYGPPGNDLYFPDPVAGDIVFNVAMPFIMPAGAEGAPIAQIGNDVENLFLHELGHAAIGLGHPDQGPGDVMYVYTGCCDVINREPSPDDIAGAQLVYGPSSIPACSNGIDDDGDGLEDLADPGCASAGDIDERSPYLPCDNGADDDGDGRADFDPRTFADAPNFTAGRGDPGCSSPSAPRENPQCQNGIDDDGQRGTDFDGGVSARGPGNGDPQGADVQCFAKPWSDRERATTCGLGAEVALVLAPLYRGWRRLRS